MRPSKKAKIGGIPNKEIRGFQQKENIQLEEQRGNGIELMMISG